MENAPEGNDEFAEVAKSAIEKFDSAMDEDFNTRDAIASIFDFSKEVNKYLEGEVAKPSLEAAIETFKVYDEILSIFQFEKDAGDHMLAPLMDIIIDIRQKARAEKNFALADEIRDRLKELGIEIQDSGVSVKWKRI